MALDTSEFCFFDMEETQGAGSSSPIVSLCILGVEGEITFCGGLYEVHAQPDQRRVLVYVGTLTDVFDILYCGSHLPTDG